MSIFKGVQFSADGPGGYSSVPTGGTDAEVSIVSKGEMDLLSDEALDETSKETPIAPKPTKEAPKVEGETEEVEEEEIETEETPEETEEKVEGEEQEEGQEKPGRIYAAVRKTYPKFFKEFPEVAQAINKVHKFEQFIASPEDAEEAARKAVVFDQINEQLLDGQAEGFAETLSKANPQGFQTFAKNLFKELEDKHKDTYVRVATPMLRTALVTAIQDAKSASNDNLFRSAQHVARHIWGEKWKDVILGKNEEENKPSARETQLESQLRQFQDTQADNFEREWATEANNGLVEIAKGSFTKFDKEKNLTIGQKKYVISESRKLLGDRIKADSSIQSEMKSLLTKAAKAGYVGDWKARVTSAYLARAKNLLPAIQQRLILQELKKDVVEEGKRVGKKPALNPGGKPQLKSSAQENEKKLREHKMSDIEFLAAD